MDYCSYYGKKIDPEPGRCRRTDGKKWRCSKDAYPDSKYCERHMHRGRNHSRNPVESQSTSQSLSTVMSHSTSGSSSRTGSFQNLPLRSIVDNVDSLLGGNAPKWQIEPLSYGINNKEYRYPPLFPLWGNVIKASSYLLFKIWNYKARRGMPLSQRHQKKHFSLIKLKRTTLMEIT